MVEIRHVTDAASKEFDTYKCERLADFLRHLKSFCASNEDLASLRFFKGDILGEEIDTECGSFIDISDGLIVAIDDRTIPRAGLPAIVYYVATAVIAAVAAIALAPTPETPSIPSSKQTSATNRLAEATNEPRINERIDDIFGKVAKHTPPLWQVPYRIGVDNQEVEVNLVCIGRGKYEHQDSRVFDGDTVVGRIPNASVNFYGPNTYPGNGAPYHIIGDQINEKIGIYRQPNDLNPSELLPPNDLDVNAITWRITTTDNGDGTYSVEFFGSNAESEGVDFTEFFEVGDQIDIRDIYYTQNTGSITLYYITSGPQSKSFQTATQTDLSGVQTADAVTSDRFTFTTSNSEWAGLSNYTPIQVLRDCKNRYQPTDPNYVEFITLDPEISNDIYYTRDDEFTNSRLDVKVVNQYPSVGVITNNLVGPVTINSNVDEVIINCTSASGFFKLFENSEISIAAEVEAIYDQLDSNGNVIPGTEVRVPLVYESNQGNLRFSVYQTYRLDFSGISNDVRLYMRRTTNRDKRSNISNVDKIEWSSVYTYEPIPEGWDSGDVTLAHWYSPSNTQSQLQKQRKLNLDVTRKITQYLGNGSFGPKEDYATDDFSQIIIHTALDPYCGRLDLEQINADGLIATRDAIVSYFGDEEMIKFGYDFDDIQMAYDDMFIMICDVVNCIPYTQNGIYDAFFERKQDESTIQITHRNKIPDTETVEDIFESKYDGIELTFRSNESGIEETISIPDDGASTNPQSITLYGCTTEIQAYRKALRLYNKQIYHTRNVEFGVDEFGRMIVPGQRVDSPDGTRFVHHKGNSDGYRIYDGEVVEFSGLNVELSQPVDFTEGEDHYIQFTTLTGENSELILCTPGGDEFNVILSSPPIDSLYDGYDRDKTKFTFCSEQKRDSIALIPKIIETNIDNGKEVNTISFINYDYRYYQGDTETL
ncbi:TMhelix containing protein [Vibrio phage Seahorse]|uniref:TMhelix containing protein n=1 Tax=Vibrio phage Seahorse TaxID=2662136 RepID=A0A6B7SEC7_9CAUD|nr:TMhelix containing protein [Vibrio phage Seahorse]QGF21014.1 TMhelix containing protein [Vibrio phage Seahorse]